MTDGHLTAVVSDTPARGRRSRRADVSMHDLVIQAAAREHTVIPFSFGSVLGGEKDVLELLSGTRAALGEVLHAIRGRVELGLVVRWNRESVVAEIGRENEEVRALRERIFEAENGASYWERLRLARIVEAALEERIRSDASEIRAAIRPHSVAVRGAEAEGDDVVMASALLVERPRVDPLLRVTERLAETYDGRLFFECSGPKPPTSFVTVKLRLESAG